MSKLRYASLVLALLACLGIGASPALGASASFTGTLTTFTGSGSGVATSGAVFGAGTGSYDVSSFGFTVPSALFATDRTTPVGWTPNAPQTSLYTIRQVVNQSSSAGSFGPGADLAAR